jgi:hypothetical protein
MVASELTAKDGGILPIERLAAFLLRETTGGGVPPFLWVISLGALIAVVLILLRKEPEEGATEETQAPEETTAPMRISLRLVFAIPLLAMAAYILLGWKFTTGEGVAAGVAVVWVFVMAVGWGSLLIGGILLLGALGKRRE